MPHQQQLRVTTVSTFLVQGGSCVELLTASGSDPLASWALQGSVKREFHQQLKGYVVSLTGSSATTSLQLPSSRDKRTRELCSAILLAHHLALIVS